MGGGVNKLTCAGWNFPQLASFDIPLVEKQVEVKGTEWKGPGRFAPLFTGRSAVL